MKNFKINGSFFVTILTKIESIWALIILLTTKTNKGMEATTIQIDTWGYWLFQIFSIIVIFSISYYVLGKIEHIKNKTLILNLMSLSRLYEYICPTDDFIENNKKNDETKEEFAERYIKEEMEKYLKIENQDICNRSFRVLSDIPPKKTNKIIEEIYEDFQVKNK